MGLAYVGQWVRIFSNCYKDQPYCYISIIVHINRKMSSSEGPGGLRGSHVALRAPKTHEKLRLKQGTLNGYVHNAYCKQIFSFNRVFTTILIMQLLLLYLYIEYDIAEKDGATDFLDWSMVCSLLACFVCAQRFLCRDSSYGIPDEIESTMVGLALKIAILLVGPYPFIEDVTFDTGAISSYPGDYQYKLNHLLTIISFFKNACFMGILLTYSKYMRPRSYRISMMYGSKPGSIFALRAIFKESPFYVVLTVFSTSIVIFTFAFRVAEWKVYTSSGAGTVYSNMVWMTMITMTTVGYGDIVPHTSIGRVIGSLCVTWGGLLLSVLVVVLTNAFSLNKNEFQALRSVKKLQSQTKLRHVAGLLLRESLWRVWTNYKYRLNKPTKLRQRKLQRHFQQMRRGHSSSFQTCNSIQFYNQFLKRLEGAQSNVQNLATNNLNIISHLSQEYIFKETPLAGKVPRQLVPRVLVKRRRK